MAWRPICRKFGRLKETSARASWGRAGEKTSPGARGLVLLDQIKKASVFPVSAGSISGCSSLSLTRQDPAVRHFRAAAALSARRKEEPGNGRDRSLKLRKEKPPPVELPYVPPRPKPHVEAPYTPPRPKRPIKPLPDRTVDIFDGMTLLELAKRTGQTVRHLQEILANVGEKVSSEFHPIGVDVAELVATEVGVNVRRLQSTEGSAALEPRPPVVTVMGHVDHGKTSLLDALRQTSVAAKEAGGITQHLGAFVVAMPSGSSITFLDTPGHAAFSAMRARGAAVTDIVVLVVAADDGVMPQTLEAMRHAKEAGVPVVVAINKCDKPSANAERVKVQLGSEGLPLEEMGGDVQVVQVSALKGTGLDKLEEALLLQAEMMELKAKVDGPAQAYVVEARLDRGRGPLATAIVKSGTLLCGQHVVVGAQWGRIRAIRDMAGKALESAGPAMPVEIEGLKGLPMAGDDVTVVGTEERARLLSDGRRKKQEKDRLRMACEERPYPPTAAENPAGGAAEEDADDDNNNNGTAEKPQTVELPIIVKADVQGSGQAVRDALKSLNSPQVFVNVVHVGIGPVAQSDVDLAHACGACIVGFNIRTPPSSLSLAADRACVKIIIHRVIYHLLEEMGRLIVERAPGTVETLVAGEAKVLHIFELKGRSRSKGPDVVIAGCRVLDGRLTRAAVLRVMRSGEVVFEGSCASLKREKQDVEAVEQGAECGLVIQDCCDFRVGDIVQCLEQVNRKPKFVSSESGAVRIEC